MRKDLFVTSRGPAATATNNAGGKAYSLSNKQALAMFACTGCFGDTFYVDAKDQLDQVKKLCDTVSPEFIAKLAIYSRHSAFMKDAPAYLLAHLACNDVELFKKVFPIVADNGKIVRNFVQIIRSGVLGRKSLGSALKKSIQNWLNGRKAEKLLWDSIGNDPSLADVIKMVHVKPDGNEHEAMFGYIVGAEYNKKHLPKIVKDLEAFKDDDTDVVPKVDMRLLTSMPLSKRQWIAIAKAANWTTTRMNLNTFLRHGVFNDNDMVKLIANRLADPDQVKNAKCFPYQILTAYQNVGKDGVVIPQAIKNALQDAMEHATKNVGSFGDKTVYVCVDVSGSMLHPVTGDRGYSATTVTRCIDVAALVGSVVIRNNKDATVIPFNGDVVACDINPRDSVVTNSQKLANLGGRSTDCSAPLRSLNNANAKGDLVIFVSDNESWINGTAGFGDRRLKSTKLMEEWRKFKKRNPNAKLVCIDVTPGATVQALDDKDILNVGGFSDNVFSVIHNFVNGSKDAWLKEIEKVELG